MKATPSESQQATETGEGATAPSPPSDELFDGATGASDYALRIDGPDGRKWLPSKVMYLNQLEKRFMEGDLRAALEAVSCCAQWNQVMPQWLAKSIVGLIDSVESENSWDDVFGKPHPKSHTPRVYAKRLKVTLPLYLSINEQHEKTGAPLEELFENIGKQFGLSASTAEKYYRAFVKNDLVITPDDFKTK